MKEYYFLFALAFVWTAFASVQDLRKREVANWLNFSLIAFALVYRAFYSAWNSNYEFFLLGLAGFGVYFVFAYALYYAKAFAGGDAKLLMGFGVILPYSSYETLIMTSLIFLLLLFLVGAIYSLIYSVFIVVKNKKKFSGEFKKRVRKNKFSLAVFLLLFLFCLIYGFFNLSCIKFNDCAANCLPTVASLPWLGICSTLAPHTNSAAFFLALIFLIPLLWTYTKSLDVCMLKLVAPGKLTEGDWLEKDVRLSRGKIIRKTVHGLSLEEIRLLKRYKKKVLIKEGIPFVPAFLFTLLIMVFAFSVLGLRVESLFLFLF
jgi:Flp pilus assembly protein protease CpaA